MVATRGQGPSQHATRSGQPPTGKTPRTKAKAAPKTKTRVPPPQENGAGTGVQTLQFESPPTTPMGWVAKIFGLASDAIRSVGANTEAEEDTDRAMITMLVHSQPVLA